MSIRATLSSPVVYPAEDHMGESEVQRFICTLLMELLQSMFRERGVVAHVSADTFFYWEKGNPDVRIAPDLYVIPGVAQTEEVDSWFLWERECTPSFALEVVGKNPAKDYEEAPAIYRALGVDELVLFDPRATARSRKRHRWTIYRKNSRGQFVAHEQHERSVTYLRSLDCYLVHTELDEERVRLRVALDEKATLLVPTDAERERAKALEERAALEREVAQLREELRKLRGE